MGTHPHILQIFILILVIINGRICLCNLSKIKRRKILVHLNDVMYLGWNKNMGWKKFLIPDWRRLLFFVITMGGLNYWWISGHEVLDARLLFGLPLGFYPIGSPMGEPFGYPPKPVVEFSWFNFMIDIIFWYLVACIIFYSYDKFKSWLKNDNTVFATP